LGSWFLEFNSFLSRDVSRRGRCERAFSSKFSVACWSRLVLKFDGFGRLFKIQRWGFFLDLDF